MGGGGLSIHVVDARNGLPAMGLCVEVRRGKDQAVIATGQVGCDALLNEAQLASPLEEGSYEVHFHAGTYFEKRGMGDGLAPLLDVVVFAFEIEDSSRHIHLPLKLTPVGYSLFKGDP